jgi:hypothetical protein
LRLNSFAIIGTIVLFLLPGTSLFGQRVSVGFVAGGHANYEFVSHYHPTPGFNPAIAVSDKGGYLVGATMEVRLVNRLSILADALYKPLQYRHAAVFGMDRSVLGYAHASVITWQFPVLAKYRFTSGKLRPYLEGGPSFRIAGNLNATNPSNHGVSAGAGVEAQWRALSLSPGVRYTRWAPDRFPLSHDVQTRPDQVEFLFRVTWNASRAARPGSPSGIYPFGRRVSVGVVAGTGLTDDIPGAMDTRIDGLTYRSRSVRSLQAGPLVEVRLVDRFSIEANAISRTMNRVTEVVGGGCPAPERFLLVCRWPATSGRFWEFPVLLKYRLFTGPWRPFLAAGPSFRLPKEMGSAWLPTYGATAGAGVEYSWKRLKISPTVRFTHWGPETPRIPGGHGVSGVFRNQLQFLVGVSF